MKWKSLYTNIALIVLIFSVLGCEGDYNSSSQISEERNNGKSSSHFLKETRYQPKDLSSPLLPNPSTKNFGSSQGIASISGFSGPVSTWHENLRRYEGNPVIVGRDVSPNHSFFADPYLLVVGDRLFMFFEAFLLESVSYPSDKGLGEIWMAESYDGKSWKNFNKLSVNAIHFSHPQALIHEGKVYVFYNHNQNGSIYSRWSPLGKVGQWSDESVIFTALNHGWDHMVEFSIFEEQGNWYLLGITGNRKFFNGEPNNSLYSRVLRKVGLGRSRLGEDQWVRGRWANGFTTNWDNDSQEIGDRPLIDISGEEWVTEIVEITSLKLNEQWVLFMGVTKPNRQQAIGTFAINHLSPEGMDGRWITEGFTFPLSGAEWEGQNIHRGHAVWFHDEWVYVFDGRNGKNWKIGIATKSPHFNGMNMVSAS
ncbi:hypothetical protein [Candidatus Nitronereus thalassa]|uniref:Glucosamine inositolphosphorylceramide transferase 1 N-terminal domain-containing protein n=1 Tax=Candidatus Nitronereus thalassa TaxID=3020898 RepID=A0ABU3K577_9BACT|nr:hypothetical protein [Candidatus Nitronereus thalassa]MDT7041569.1 hypothetical protein [Candidatus Nitronereus thalassa]